MGIIINQSAKNLFTTYLGFGIGAINTLFLYTNFLEPRYYGLVSFLLSAANLIWPLMAFGVQNTLVKFFSSYDTKMERDKLLSMVLLLPLIVAIVLGSIGFLSYGWILDYFSDQNTLVRPYVWLIFVVAVATAYFEVFFAWAKIHYRSVFGNFLKEVFHRVCIALLLLLVFAGFLSVSEFIYTLAGVYLLRAIIMAFYAFRLYIPEFHFSFPRNKWPVLKYSALILIAGSVAMVLLDLDKVMIERFLPIENVAIYSIAIYISSVIAVPSKAMHQITYPLTAILLNSNDRVELQSLYRRSSINLLIVSGLIFLLILTNLRPLYELIPKEYGIPFSIVIIISSVKLYDNLLGNINSILFNSDYYRLVLGIGVLLAVLAFVFNLIFIPIYGLFGAALATFLAFAIYNTAKFLVVLWKFKIHPFSGKTAICLGLIAAVGILFFYWDLSFHPVVNIILKSAVVSVIYLLGVFFFRLSNDISELLQKYLKGPD